MKIINHHLCKDDGTPYPFKESPNHGNKMQPKYLIMHFTAGSDCKSSVDHLCNPKTDDPASAHLVICRNGNITQLVPFDTIAWHAGRSMWQGLERMNKYSVGIEMDNMGELKRESDGYHPWYHYERNWKNRKVPYEKYPPISDEVLKDTPQRFDPTVKRHWHRYTKEQLDVALEVATLLVKTYQLKEILGHDEITRKTNKKPDPGPDFPLDEFRARVKTAYSPVTEIYQVTVESLNIRQGPGKEYDAIGDPLSQGARVQILESSDEDPRWKKIDVLDDDRAGWVNSSPFNSPVTLIRVAS